MLIAAEGIGRAGRRVEQARIALLVREERLQHEVAARQVAEAALRQSEAQLWFVTNHAPVGIAQYDREGRYKFVNRPYASMFGLQPAEVIPKHPREVIGEDVYVHAKPHIEAALAGYPREFEIHLPATGLDRRSMHAQVSYEPERDATGATVGFLAAITDITERKRAEQKLRESEERFSGILSSATDAIISVDERQRITLFNKGAEAMFWCAAKQAIGRPLDQFLPEPFRQAHRIQVEEFGRNGVTARHMGRTGMVCGLRTNGQEFPAEASISRIESGGEKLYTVILRDVTERVQMKAALADAKRRTDAILESAGEAIFGLNGEGLCTFINPAGAAMFGYHVDELIGKNMHEMVHHSYPDGRVYLVHDCPIYTSLLDGKTFRRDDEVFWHRSGAPIPVSYTSTPILEEERPTGAVVVIRDITARKRADDALHEAQERLQRWNMELEQAVRVKTAELKQSHEGLRAMATELNLAEQRERKRLAIELHDHLQQLLILGKLAMGQGKRTAAGVTDYDALIQKADGIFSEALAYTRTLVADLSPTVLRGHGLAAALKWLGTSMQKYHQIVTVSAPDDGDVKLPENQVLLLFQCVRELLINASKHAGIDTVTVLMEQNDGHLRIEVRDEGAGFNVTTPVPAAPGTSSDGLSSKFGLLSIGERMRALGGLFHIQSVPGQGTTAMLTLPLTKSQQALSPQDSDVQDPAHSPFSRLGEASTQSLETQKKTATRVLLVDDHAMVRQGLRSVLDAYADIQVVGEACDGEEAVQLVERLQPAVVVMDINMPKMNGIESTAHIKLRRSETIVIGLSINAARENQEAMAKAGAERLMTKEAAVEQLYSVIQEAVKKRGEGCFMHYAKP